MGKIDELKFKARNAGRKVKEKAIECIEYAVDHPEETAIVMGLGAGAAKLTSKGISAMKQNQAIKEDIRHRDHDIYDHSTGTWYVTKTKMTNDDRLRMERLMSEGYSKGEALRIMHKI